MDASQTHTHTSAHDQFRFSIQFKDSRVQRKYTTFHRIDNVKNLDKNGMKEKNGLH